MIFLLTFPLVTTSVILFLSLFFFKSNVYFLVLSFCLSFLLNFFFLRQSFKQDLAELKNHLFSKRNLLQTLIILVFVAGMGYLLSPMVIERQINNFSLLQFNGQGDYFKHLYVMAPMIADGIPPRHPYFPPETMSYYFGFYTIPVAISIIFSVQPTITLFIFTLLTLTYCLIVISSIYSKYLKSIFARSSALILLLSGVGVDIIPLSVVVSRDLSNIVFNQTFLNGLGLQIVNTYTTIMQSPQHFLAATLIIVSFHHLLKEKPQVKFLSFTLTFIFFCSIFMSITMSLWLLLCFIFFKDTRLTLIKTGIVCAFLIIPYLFVLQSRQNIISTYLVQPYPFITNLPTGISYFINLAVDLFWQYGPIIITSLIIFLFKGYYKKYENKVIFLGLALPFFLTWFIKTPDFNDFAMRTTVPTQLILPIFFLKSLEKAKKRLREVLILVLAVAILIGTFSLLYEYRKAWQKRFVVHPTTSELIYEVRKLPSDLRLAAIEKDEWTYLIPPLGFKHILVPHLWEAAVSTTPKVGQEHGVYEQMAFNIFLNPTEADNLDELIKERNYYFQQTKDYIGKYEFDTLIVNNRVWVKKGINPWKIIFEKIKVTPKSFATNFTLYDYSNLQNALMSKQFFINNNNIRKIPIKDKLLKLDSGLWFISSCANDKNKYLRLEFEDYYSLFNQELKNSKSCIGNLFYLPENEDVQLTSSSTIDEVNVFPIEFK